MSEEFPAAKYLPCGKLAYNEASICGFPAYRCSTCFTIWGSISCPCREFGEKIKAIEMQLEQEINP